MPESPEVSILIPSTRPEALSRLRKSLSNQTFKDFEVVTSNEQGPLNRIRNKLGRLSKGKIIIFVDDDIVCTCGWLSAIVDCFRQTQSLAGVSGPSIIGNQYKRQRDIFHYSVAKWLYDKIFCYRQHLLPGHITDWGAWTTGASNSNCTYEGEVMFLEACNMAFRKNIWERLGGFDETYGGVGEWAEPDLCFRIRRSGYKLWFTQGAKVYHEPSRSGAYVERLQVSSRMANYELFWKRWCKPGWKLMLYKLFVRFYFAFKAFKR